jgi:DNA-binding ferritin-like protein
MSAANIHFFFTMREQIKLYHWQTYSYSRHKATDEVIENLDKNIDEFVEVYMGKYGRPKITAKTSSVRIGNMNEKSAVGFIKRCITILLGDLVKGLVAARDSDLFNIRDEILADLNQLLYLFTLR